MVPDQADNVGIVLDNENQFPPPTAPRCRFTKTAGGSLWRGRILVGIAIERLQ